MEYIVKRASQLGNKIQPCEEAKQETVAYNAYKDSEEKVWTIKISTLCISGAVCRYDVFVNLKINCNLSGCFVAS